MEYELLSFAQPVVVEQYGGTFLRIAIVADTVEELTSPAVVEQVLEAATASIERRQLTPLGRWAIGVMQVDDPDWATHLDPAVVARVSSTLQEINGYVIVYVLIDTGRM